MPAMLWQAAVVESVRALEEALAGVAARLERADHDRFDSLHLLRFGHCGGSGAGIQVGDEACYLDVGQAQVGHWNVVELGEHVGGDRLTLCQHQVGFRDPPREPLRLSPVAHPLQVWSDQGPATDRVAGGAFRAEDGFAIVGRLRCRRGSGSEPDGCQ